MKNKKDQVNIEESLKSLPKPELSRYKTQSIHQALMSQEPTEESRGNTGFFRKQLLAGAGGFVVIASLLFFVFIATLFDGDDIRLGGNEGENGETDVEELLFTGESENWSGEYYFYGKDYGWDTDGLVSNSAFHSDEIKIVYKGTLEELATVENLEITYRSGSGSSGSLNETYDEYPPQRKEFTFASGGNGSFRHNGRSVQVTIKWDDYEESFIIDKPENVEKRERRGLNIHRKIEAVKSYISMKVDDKTLLHAHMNFDENEQWFVDISLKEMLDEEIKGEIRKIIGDEFEVRFSIADQMGLDLRNKQREIERVVFQENKIQFDDFDITSLSTNSSIIKLEVGITPYSDEYAQQVYDYFGDELIIVVDSEKYIEDMEEETETD